MTGSASIPRVIWIYPGSLSNNLNAAACLETVRELRKQNCHVTLVNVGPDEQQNIRGVEVVSIPRPDIYIFNQFAFHLRVYRRLLYDLNAFDIVLFRSMSAPWIFPVRLIRAMKGKNRPLLVMDTRTITMKDAELESWKDRLLRLYTKLMENWGNHWADGRTAITQRMADLLQIPSGKLWGVWPSGADPVLFSKAEELRSWPLPGEQIDLVYIGALHVERNLMVLSKAVIQANHEGMAFQLTLAGSGSDEANLRTLAQAAGGAINLLAPVPHEEVVLILADAHIGVLPFPDEEKFRVCSPIKLFEYMAAGLPILATRIDCHTDVLESGTYTFWAENSDVTGLLNALRVVWKNWDLLSAMGRQATLAAQDWTWRASATKLKLALGYGLSTI